MIINVHLLSRRALRGGAVKKLNRAIQEITKPFLGEGAVVVKLEFNPDRVVRAHGYMALILESPGGDAGDVTIILTRSN